MKKEHKEILWDAIDIYIGYCAKVNAAQSEKFGTNWDELPDDIKEVHRRRGIAFELKKNKDIKKLLSRPEVTMENLDPGWEYHQAAYNRLARDLERVSRTNQKVYGN